MSVRQLPDDLPDVTKVLQCEGVDYIDVETVAAILHVLIDERDADAAELVIRRHVTKALADTTTVARFVYRWPSA